MPVNYEIVKKIFSFPYGKGNGEIQLNLIKWGDNPAKLDLRKWSNGKAQKGITFEEEELRALYNELKKYYVEENKDDDEVSDNLIDFRQFIVQSDMKKCENKGHQYKKVITKAPIYSDITGKVTMQEVYETYYCKDCKAYYIGKYGYDILKKMGHIMCPVFKAEEFDKFVKDGYQFINNGGKLNKESELYHIGYNAKADELSETQRHMILKYAYLSGYMSKGEIVGHLSFLIWLNENSANKEAAIEKWKNDRLWMMGLPIDTTIPIGISKIIIKED